MVFCKRCIEIGSHWSQRRRGRGRCETSRSELRPVGPLQPVALLEPNILQRLVGSWPIPGLAAQQRSTEHTRSRADASRQLRTVLRHVLRWRLPGEEEVLQASNTSNVRSLQDLVRFVYM